MKASRLGALAAECKRLRENGLKSAYDHGNMTMVMQARRITATKLKAQLLGALDDVAETGMPYVVTKHGKPVAKLVPVEDDRPLLGSVTMLVSEEELLAPLDVEWDAMAE